MSNGSVLLDVRDLEDWKLKKDYQTIRQIFRDARAAVDEGHEVILHQTFDDSPPEILERINVLDRLAEIESYYLPQDVV